MGKRPGRTRRSLRLENLEDRSFFDAQGLDALTIAPMWFTDLSGGATSHAGLPSLQSTETTGQPDVSIVSTNTYDWIVRFNTGAVAAMHSLAETTSLLAGSGIEFEAMRGLGLVGQVLVRSTAVAQETVRSYLASNANVAQYELDVLQDFQQVANDPRMGSLWGMENTGQTGGTADADIDAPAAWNISTGSHSVVVAVVDTGVDYRHPDLAANIWTNPGEIAGNGIDDDHNGFIDDLHGYDFANNDGNPVDDQGHGTHVAGTIGAVGNNSVGVVGVNWNVSIMALKFLDATGSGYTSDAVRAINYATMMRSSYGVNVRVTSNSWGGAGYSAQLQTAIQAGGNAGILFVAAAGNAGQNNDVAGNYPSNYNVAGLIAVAATGANDALAGFSNYGLNSVDIAAPGVNIYSTYLNNGYASLSGTSMATPHVSGVAALAWSVAPNATVAEVRNAILQGADRIGGLQGKVATGGRLNAANTLALLASDGPHAPTMNAFAASPDAVAAGGNVALTARGVADLDGFVTRVAFYEDTNADGQFGDGDRLLGVDSTVVGGDASIGINTSGWTIGRHVVFAVATDNQSLQSTPAAATLDLIVPDDHGDSASAATRLQLGATAQGTLGQLGDVDWFAFDAVAGREYEFVTTLGTLSDSTLSLYDRNGTSLLRFDDDSGGGFASQIVWSAPGSGAFYVAVAAYGNIHAGSYTLSARSTDAPPTLDAVADQTMSYRQNTLTVELSGHDTNGAPLAYTAVAVAGDPLQLKAHDLDQRLGLFFNTSYYKNSHGANEKWLTGRNGLSYYLLPNGELHLWTGSMRTSPRVDTLSEAYYADPSRLWNAQMPELVATGDVSVQVDGSTLTIDPRDGFQGVFFVQASVTNGHGSATRTFRVSIGNAAPVWQTIADQSLSHRETRSLTLSAADADGDAVGYTATVVAFDAPAQNAYDANRLLGLSFRNSYYENRYGANEKWVIGTGNAWYFILPNGELHAYNGSMATSPLVAELNSTYWQNPSRLTGARAPTPTPIAGLQVGVDGNSLTLTPETGVAGTYHVLLTAYDGNVTVTQVFHVTVTNSAPSLAALGTQTMSYAAASHTLDVWATDADGDPLTYSAGVVATDLLAQRAYSVDRQLGLRYTGSYSDNWAHAGERWMLGNNNTWHFILPNGELHRWAGSIAKSPLVARFNASYYSQPELLWNALPPLSAAAVQLALSGNQLTIDPIGDTQGTFLVRTTASDGIVSTGQTFRVRVTSDAAAPAAPAAALAASADAPWASSDPWMSLRAVDTLALALALAATDQLPSFHAASETAVLPGWTASRPLGGWAVAATDTVLADRPVLRPSYTAATTTALDACRPSASKSSPHRASEAAMTRWSGAARVATDIETQLLDEVHALLEIAGSAAQYRDEAAADAAR